MKYLGDYMNDQQTAIFVKYGAFFAFSNRQFEDKKAADIDYVRLSSGLMSPKDNAKPLLDGLEAIYKAAIKQDIEENGVNNIIHRELANLECQITGDYSEVVDRLTDYGISDEQVKYEWASFMQNCIDNDYF